MNARFNNQLYTGEMDRMDRKKHIPPYGFVTFLHVIINIKLFFKKQHMKSRNVFRTSLDHEISFELYSDIS